MQFERKWKNVSMVKVGKGKWEHTHEYAMWKSMGNRVGKSKNYKDVMLSEYFLNYDDWLDWARTQKGFMSRDENGKLFHMDKDLLSGGAGVVYCPNSVVFIPSQLNSMVTRSSKGKLRGIQTFHRGGRDVHTVKFNLDGKTHYYGAFEDIEVAKEVAADVWKRNLITVASRYDLDTRVEQAIFELRYDIFSTVGENPKSRAI